MLQLGNAVVEGGKTFGGERTDPDAVVGAVEREQFADLFEREAGSLCAADEAQAAYIVVAVAADLAGRARRLGKEPAALVVTDGFDADPRGPREPADRVRSFTERRRDGATRTACAGRRDRTDGADLFRR